MTEFVVSQDARREPFSVARRLRSMRWSRSSDRWLRSRRS
jgi:hypothetical protein